MLAQLFDALQFGQRHTAARRRDQIERDLGLERFGDRSHVALRADQRQAKIGMGGMQRPIPVVVTRLRFPRAERDVEIGIAGRFLHRLAHGRGAIGALSDSHARGDVDRPATGLIADREDRLDLGSLRSRAGDVDGQVLADAELGDARRAEHGLVDGVDELEDERADDGAAGDRGDRAGERAIAGEPDADDGVHRHELIAGCGFRARAGSLFSRSRESAECFRRVFLGHVCACVLRVDECPVRVLRKIECLRGSRFPAAAHRERFGRFLIHHLLLRVIGGVMEAD